MAGKNTQKEFLVWSVKKASEKTHCKKCVLIRKNKSFLPRAWSPQLCVTFWRDQIYCCFCLSTPAERSTQYPPVSLYTSLRSLNENEKHCGGRLICALPSRCASVLGGAGKSLMVGCAASCTKLPRLSAHSRFGSRGSTLKL